MLISINLKKKDYIQKKPDPSTHLKVLNIFFVRCREYTVAGWTFPAWFYGLLYPFIAQVLFLTKTN